MSGDRTPSRREGVGGIDSDGDGRRSLRMTPEKDRELAVERLRQWEHEVAVSTAAAGSGEVPLSSSGGSGGGGGSGVGSGPLMTVGGGGGGGGGGGSERSGGRGRGRGRGRGSGRPSESESESDPFTRRERVRSPLPPPPPTVAEVLAEREQTEKERKKAEFSWSVKVSAGGCFMLSALATLAWGMEWFHDTSFPWFIIATAVFVICWFCHYFISLAVYLRKGKRARCLFWLHFSIVMTMLVAYLLVYVAWDMPHSWLKYPIYVLCALAIFLVVHFNFVYVARSNRWLIIQICVFTDFALGNFILWYIDQNDFPFWEYILLGGTVILAIEVIIFFILKRCRIGHQSKKRKGSPEEGGVSASTSLLSPASSQYPKYTSPVSTLTSVYSPELLSLLISSASEDTASSSNELLPPLSYHRPESRRVSGETGIQAIQRLMQQERERGRERDLLQEMTEASSRSDRSRSRRNRHSKGHSRINSARTESTAESLYKDTNTLEVRQSFPPSSRSSPDLLGPHTLGPESGLTAVTTSHPDYPKPSRPATGPTQPSPSRPIEPRTHRHPQHLRVLQGRSGGDIALMNFSYDAGGGGSSGFGEGGDSPVFDVVVGSYGDSYL
eukprot:TRINITY_DN3513_c0_g1_i1.p1 TRINITY_DN3513_c0_g1~~TRINITY_DN3513_c0_g1_i1.p1  ORF type:complete len:636 (+),score=109.22 TRINITY_DN3513_c0_g1_i1:75-1910(+)